MTFRVPATFTFAVCLLLGGVSSALALFVPHAWLGPRLPLALACALFVPGYLLICSFFPSEADMGHLLRFGLSLACSFPLIILLTLAMSVTPFERSATVQILAMDGLILLLAAVATWRQRREPAGRRLAFLLSTGDRSLFRDRFTWLSLALAIVLIAAALTSVISSTHDLTTALSIPTGGTATNPIQADRVTVDVQSHETATETFTISISWQGQILGQSAPFTLQPGQTAVQQIATTAPPGQGPAPVDVMLLKQGNTVPFRQLRVWMRTVPYRLPS
jgi:uncharacterized membrane protein